MNYLHVDSPPPLRPRDLLVLSVLLKEVVIKLDGLGLLFFLSVILLYFLSAMTARHALRRKHAGENTAEVVECVEITIAVAGATGVTSEVLTTSVLRAGRPYVNPIDDVGADNGASWFARTALARTSQRWQRLIFQRLRNVKSSPVKTPVRRFFMFRVSENSPARRSSGSI